MAKQIAIQINNKNLKKLDRMATSHDCSMSQIVEKALDEFWKRSKEKLRRKKSNRMFNYAALASMISMFNALFYYFGLDVGPALAAFVFLFIATVLLFFVYKLLNRKKKLKIK